MQTFALLDPDKTERQVENLESNLRHLIVSAYQTHLEGLSPVGRAVGNFLFPGPTASGGDIKIGAPPGYLGHREPHALLLQEALNQHQTETVN